MGSALGGERGDGVSDGSGDESLEDRVDGVLGRAMRFRPRTGKLVYDGAGTEIPACEVRERVRRSDPWYTGILDERRLVRSTGIVG